MAKERELKWVKEAQEEMENEEVMTEEEAVQENPEETPDDAEPVEGEVVDTEPESEEAAPEDSKLAEAVERYQRLFAEFDNFRKRTEKEKAARYDMGARDVVSKILPVLDNFELALKNVPDAEKDSPFVDGMEKIQKLFLTTLEGLGVTPIDAVGKEFDPAFHNAVLHVEDEEAGENIVVEELQKGYMYKDQVLRYAMVTVAN